MPQPSTNAAYAWTGHVLAALRAALDRADFVEILPAILSKRFEPGARHSIAVIGDRAVPGVRRQGAEITVSGRDHYFLPVSHCVEKQLALEFLDRVYCVAPCLRLLMEGEDHSGRHLYSFFQIEIEWRTEDVDEVLSTTETLLAHTSELLRDRLAGSALLDQAALRRIDALGAGPYPRIPFGGARERVRSVGGHVNPHAAGDVGVGGRIKLGPGRRLDIRHAEQVRQVHDTALRSMVALGPWSWANRRSRMLSKPAQ